MQAHAVDRTRYGGGIEHRSLWTAFTQCLCLSAGANKTKGNAREVEIAKSKGKDRADDEANDGGVLVEGKSVRAVAVQVCAQLACAVAGALCARVRRRRMRGSGFQQAGCFHIYCISGHSQTHNARLRTLVLHATAPGKNSASHYRSSWASMYSAHFEFQYSRRTLHQRELNHEQRQRAKDGCGNVILRVLSLRANIFI